VAIATLLRPALLLTRGFSLLVGSDHEGGCHHPAVRPGPAARYRASGRAQPELMDVPARPISVLIVDDNELVGESLARGRETPDIRVVAVVSTAAEALAATLEHHPDVVLMDYRLGRDNGVSVARTLLQSAPTTRVLIMTGDPTARTRAEALDAGCMGCVGKTIHTGTELPALIRRAYSGEFV
jgi:CheY-like chemotaxis protein